MSAMVDTTREPKYCAVWRAGHAVRIFHDSTSRASSHSFMATQDVQNAVGAAPRASWQMLMKGNEFQWATHLRQHRPVRVEHGSLGDGNDCTLREFVQRASCTENDLKTAPLAPHSACMHRQRLAS